MGKLPIPRFKRTHCRTGGPITEATWRASFREALLQYFPEQRGRRGFARPGLELPGGLSDEHLDAADRPCAGGFGLLEQFRLRRVVDRVEHDRFVRELRQALAQRALADVRRHA